MSTSDRGLVIIIGDGVMPLLLSKIIIENTRFPVHIYDIRPNKPTIYDNALINNRGVRLLGKNVLEDGQTIYGRTIHSRNGDIKQLFKIVKEQYCIPTKLLAESLLYEVEQMGVNVFSGFDLVDLDITNSNVKMKFEKEGQVYNVESKYMKENVKDYQTPLQCPLMAHRSMEGIVTDFQNTQSYGDYLGLSQLLSCQNTLSDSSDELLFIIQHQVTELWLKLMLHETQVCTMNIKENQLRKAIKSITRILQIQETLTKQWSVLQTLTPPEFIVFRPHLGKASGFQSYQYRAVEFALGNKNADMMKPHIHTPHLHETLEKLLNSPSLYDEYLRYLARKGHDIPEEVIERDFSQPYKPNEKVAQALERIYSDTNKYWDEYELSEKLLDVDNNFSNWRFNHMTTVKRIIGYKKGTGGSSGVPFLEKALSFTFCPDLWYVRSQL